MQREKLSAKDLCYIGIFTAVMVVCAQLAIPLPGGVPMTLQTWAISFAGIVLGAKKGALSAIIYVLLGAIGVPVFANFTGGIGIVIGPTGGFILSFPIMALLAGMGWGKQSVIWLVTWLILGTVINFLAGMLYFSFIMDTSLQTAFMIAVLPFIPSAVIRIVILTIVSKSMKYTIVIRGKGQ